MLRKPISVIEVLINSHSKSHYVHNLKLVKLKAYGLDSPYAFFGISIYVGINEFHLL